MQTDNDDILSGLNLSGGAISSQSSIEEDQPSPIDVNKLSKRVRRYVSAGCLLAVLPISNDILVMDPCNNAITILDKRGKKRYALASKSSFAETESNSCKFTTPQGILVMKLENEAKTDAVPKANKKDAFDSLPETSA